MKINNNTRNSNPTTIDERTWFYKEKDGISLLHEIYEDDVYVKTVSIIMPEVLISGLLEQNKEFVGEIAKYIPAVIHSLRESTMQTV